MFSKQLRKPKDLSSIMVLNRMIKFHRLFCECFSKLNEMNNELVKYAYFIAISLHLFSNVTMIVALSTYEFEYYVKLFFYMIITGELVVGYFFGLMCKNSSKNLYVCTKQIYNLMNHLNRINTRFCLCFAFHYEMYHNKKKFYFQMGPLGGVNRKNMLCFIMFYSSCIMFYIQKIR